jgi:hypothetical protein
MQTSPNLESALNSAGFVGLALSKTRDGYSCSVEFEDGHWSEQIEKATAAEAVCETLLRAMVVKPLWHAIPIAPPPY